MSGPAASALVDAARASPRGAGRRDARRWLAAAGALALLAPAAPPARAEVWRIESGESRVEFDVRMGQADVSGAFPRIEGEGWFDTAAPEATRLDLTIAVTALDLGNPIASHFAKGPEWFDAAAHPAGRFRLDALERAEGEDRWLAHGRLELRGVERPLSAPVLLELGAEMARARGSTQVERSAFGIGVGPLAWLLNVDERIEVRFDLVARPAAPAGAGGPGGAGPDRD